MKLTDDSGSIGLILDGLGSFYTAIPREKGREVDVSLSTVGEGCYNDAFGFKVLQCSRDIQKALTS